MHYGERLGASTDPTRAEPSLALIETASVARGYEVADAVVKVSPVELLWARTVSPGHFVTLFAGEVSETDSALVRGLEVGGASVLDSILIPNVHPDLVPAIRGPRPVEVEEALGIVEFSSVASTVLAADAAIKAAHVDLIEVRLAMHLGGKGFFLLAGSTGDVEEAVGVAADLGRSRGTLIEQVVIPRATAELLEHLR
ncbi:MAG: BMC domain-containing protein [Planctomycetes bacterium]|nr:BMC domain-containing protein [Planctomycetota bacterium]